MKDIRESKERAWREVGAINDAYDRGELDDEGWHSAMAALIVPSYLAGDERMGSGHSGTAADWEYSRGIVAELIPDEPVAILDVGCANGLLMESIARWKPRSILYGLDISPELAERARERLPPWRDRIFVGNALHWTPPHRFDLIRTGLEYVPRKRQPALLAHLLDHCERVIVGKYGEQIDERAIERDIKTWNFTVERAVERAHRNDPRICYRALLVRR